MTQEELSMPMSADAINTTDPAVSLDSLRVESVEAVLA